MKIAYCPDINIPTRAAMGVATMKTCHWFSMIGHDVTLVVPDKPDPEAGKDAWQFYGIPETFQIVRLPWIRLPGKRLVCGYLAAKKAKKEGVDLVYARSVYACYFALRFNIRAVFEYHTPVADAGWMAEKVLRSMITSRCLKRFVVISSSLKAYYRNRYGIPDEMIMVAPSGADLFEEGDPIDLGSERFSVGYTGHLYSGRGIEIILALSRSCPWADFHLVGGTETDIQRWKSAASGFNNLIFHGYVFPAEVSRYRVAFDVLIAPYQRKVAISGGGSDTSKWMSPLKLFEYLSSGKPILCSDIPVLREVVSDGETALLCDPDRITDWVNALERLREDKGLRNRLGEAALSEFTDKYSWKARTQRVLAGLDCD